MSWCLICASAPLWIFNTATFLSYQRAQNVVSSTAAETEWVLILNLPLSQPNEYQMNFGHSLCASTLRILIDFQIWNTFLFSTCGAEILPFFIFFSFQAFSYSVPVSELPSGLHSKSRSHENVPTFRKAKWTSFLKKHHVTVVPGFFKLC